MNGRSELRTIILPLACIFLLLANGLLLSQISLLMRSIGALILIIGLPGFLLGTLLFPHRLRHSPEIGLAALERPGLAVGLGYSLAIVVSLLYSYIPGGMPFWATIAIFNLVVLVLIGLIVRKMFMTPCEQGKDVGKPTPFAKMATSPRGQTLTVSLIGLLILLLFGGYFRLANSGYAEFQGDEARAMLRAAAVIQGYEDVLFIHRKGPAEILLPAVLYSLLGQINERVARLPFAVANLTGLLALWAVGWRVIGTKACESRDIRSEDHTLVRLGPRMDGAAAGWLAAMVLAADGYFIGFARIVQYQSVVFLLSVLVVWLLVWTWNYPENINRSLPVAALLLGAGLLSHYEAILVIFPAAVFLGYLGRDRGFQGKLPIGWRRSCVIGAGILAFVLAFFYLPFVLNPTFADTLRYLTESRVGVGQGLPYNNLGDFWTRSTLYNSSVYILFLGLFGIIGLVLSALHTARSNAKHPKLFWILVAWWLGPFGLAMFFTADPRTHVYTAFFGWTLVATYAAVWITATIRKHFSERLGRGPLQAAGILIFLLFFGYCGNYAYWYFVHTENEILRHWDIARPQGYPVTYDLPIRQGIFGFPMKNGWDAVKGLYEDGMLDGSYLTNTKPHVVNWYLRNVDFCTRNHRYYFLIEDNNLYKRAESAALREQLKQGYIHWATVLVEGNRRLEIYDNQLVAADVEDHWPILFPVEHFEAELAESFSDPYFDITEPYVSPQLSPLAQDKTELFLTDPINGNVIRLLGYSVDRWLVAPGKSIFVTLYWQAEQPMAQNYTVFNQVLDLAANTKVGQIDAQPGCDGRPTSIWNRGEVVVDRYRVSIREDGVPGEYPLITGIYDSQTGARLDVTDSAGQPMGNSVTLGIVTITGRDKD